MSGFGKQIAGGAAWMVGMRFIERGIGFVSTLILARLLVPEDFGIVAMAMAVYAFIEVAGQFGFDFALIRDRQAGRAEYDSAWTLGVCYGIFAAVALSLLALPTAAFFSDPRLEGVMYAMAAIAFIQSLENVGTIEFRKHFQFDRDFLLVFAKKLIAFSVTISLALALRSYWALIAGTAASRIAGVALSYIMHPYRPRLSFSRTRELFGFSKWIVSARLVQYFGNRGPDFMIGRFLDAASLGFYRVAHEIATLPTSELIQPIMRAVFPGYAAVANDRQALARAFLTVQGAILLLTLPAGVGIVLVAEPLVLVLLGSKWAPAIPLVQILGLYGAITVFQSTNHSVFNVLGVPYWGTALMLIETLILLPGIFFALGGGYALAEVVWVIVFAHLTIIPLGMALVARLIGISFADRLRVSWRPLLSVALMIAALLAAREAFSASTSSLVQLLLLIPLGAFAYSTSILALWLASGRPAGIEATLIAALQARLRRRSP